MHCKIILKSVFLCAWSYIVHYLESPQHFQGERRYGASEQVYDIHTISLITLKDTSQTGVVMHVCNPSYFRGGDRRIMSLRPAWTKLEILSQKHTQKK
jgi:hypothetical protein